jgi:prophage regulatory protein
MRAPDNSEHPKSRIIGIEEVIFRTGRSRSTIYRYINAGKFPRQAKKLEGSTSAAWYEADIDAFVESLRPEQAWKSDSTVTKKVEKETISEPELLRSPLTLDRCPGKAPQGRQVKPAEDESLVRTGIKLVGQEVYFHLPSRKLLVAVGSMSDENLAAIIKLSA